MTIVPFLHGRAFGPPDIQAMSKAPEDVCRILSLPEKAKSERELLAKKIVALAQQGESAALLRDRVLRQMASGQGGWPPALVQYARQGALLIQEQ